MNLYPKLLGGWDLPSTRVMQTFLSYHRFFDGDLAVGSFCYADVIFQLLNAIALLYIYMYYDFWHGSRN